MALRNVLTSEDEQLRKPSRHVAQITDHIRTLVGDMWETMYAHDGVGLAAPQVGVLRRVAVVDVTPPPEEETDEEVLEEGEEAPAEEAPEEDICLKYTLINPEIIWESEETVEEKEGCLSVPGIVGTVKRPACVRVRAQDIDGNEFEVEAQGMLAKAFMHEIDHLDGIIFTDKATEIEDFNHPEEDE